MSTHVKQTGDYTYVWTCDRCGDKREFHRDDKPDDWKFGPVHSPLRGRDLCGLCCASFEDWLASGKSA